ncbi:transmembrane protease serine 9-like [Diorhabda carinulata]|uniref:transmembrane protease serine 9-like n=1 Tax=Diorhabda carinulata TaxID=1163345 RepID=UPI0025A20DA4|nr:transmembrane protease serine 9-like [Diorhabda carinulata]
MRKLKKSKIRVVLGDHDVSTTAEVPAMMRAVAAIIRHKSFDSDTFNHDIALLKLRKPVQFTKQIRPICLPKTREPAGRIGTVIGWGRTSEGGMLPNIIQEVDVPILTQDQCKAMKYRASRITSYMICAGKGTQDSCQGDSGGPLLIHDGDKYEIAGIVSWGVGCGRPGYPGVYTRAFKYVNWLHRVLEDSCFLLKFVKKNPDESPTYVFLRTYYTPELSRYPRQLTSGLLGETVEEQSFTIYKLLFEDRSRGTLEVMANYVRIISVLVLCCWVTVAEQQTGRVASNTNPFSKLFSSTFGNALNRPPPRHDTPSSPCQCTCGEKNEDSRIIGGRPTNENEFPWMARLSYFNRFYCGGMLINDRYVLTAAHCVKGFVLRFMWFMIKVSFGEHDRCNDNKKPESRFVLRAIAGDFSFLHFDNDIALLRLNDRVPITQFIKPICLPKKKDNDYVGSIAIASGWGTLREDGKPTCILQKVEVPVISNEDCRKTNYSANMISDNMMCAGYPKVGQKDSCQGDSGGPLITKKADSRYELIGIVSWGNGCARPGYPGVYTRLTRYLDWILENSQDGCFCQD